MEFLASALNVFGNWTLSDYAKEILYSDEKTLFFSTHFPLGLFPIDNSICQTVALQSSRTHVHSLAAAGIWTRMFRMNTILIDKRGGNVNTLVDLFQKGIIQKLVLYGKCHKKQQIPYEEIRSGLFLIAAQTGCCIRLLTMNDITNQVMVSPIMLYSQDCQWLIETGKWKRWICEEAIAMFQSLGNLACIKPQEFLDHVRLTYFQKAV